MRVWNDLCVIRGIYAYIGRFMCVCKELCVIGAFYAPFIGFMRESD